ncbi:MAG: T9SS type A sorting domain-containing protein [Lewinella sp.]|nr:T9SS type A sorting domain-containing protein [Lewinella sp.]
MKAFLTLSLALLATCSLAAQGLNRTFAENLANVGAAIVPGAEGRWVVAGFSADYGGYPLLGEGDPMSNTLGLLPLEQFDGEILSLSNIVYSAQEAAYYCVVTRDGCDFGLPDFLIRFDLSISPLLYEEIDLLDFGLFGTHYQLAAAPDGGLMVFAGGAWGAGSLLYLSPEATSVLSLAADIPFARGLLPVGADRWVLAGPEQLLLLEYVEEEEAMTVLMTESLNSIGGLTAASDSTFWIWHADGVELRGADLSVLHELDGLESLCHGVAVDTVGTYVLADSLYFLTPGLAPAGAVALDEVSQYRVLDMAARDGTVGLVGARRIGWGYDQYYWEKEPADLFVRTFSIAGAEVPSTTDLAVEAIVPGEGVSVISPYNTNCMSARVADVVVTIRNNGTDVIEEVILVDKRAGCESFICPAWEGQHWKFDDLNLSPGEARELIIPEFVLSWVPTSGTISICLEVMAHQGTMERSVSDNRACASVTLVDTRDPAAAEAVLLYPSPVRDALQLQLPMDHPFTEARIINTAGQIVASFSLSQAEALVSLPVQQLPAGLYYLRLQGPRANTVQAFSKR